METVCPDGLARHILASALKSLPELNRVSLELATSQQHVFSVGLHTCDGSEIRCIAKVYPPPSRDDGRQAREIYFYENLSKDAGLHVPSYICTIIDQDTMRPTGILLDDLARRPNFRHALDLNMESTDVLFYIIDQLACMHAHFWGSMGTISIPANRPEPDIGTKRTQSWERCLLSGDSLRTAKCIIERFDRIREILNDGPLTLCHGDAHAKNIFYEKPRVHGPYRPHIIDWQHIHLGKGVHDLAQILIESYFPDRARVVTELAKSYYYYKLVENGVRCYSRQQFEHDFKLACCFYPFSRAICLGKKEVAYLFCFYELQGISHDYIIDIVH